MTFLRPVRTAPRVALLAAVTGLCVLCIGSAQAAQNRQANFNHGPGVTSQSIAVANVSTISGPVPGLFQGSQIGTQAYFDYINSLGGVFHRKLLLKNFDDAFNCTTSQSVYQSTVSQVFSYVGSTGIEDPCGAAILKQNPTVPDVSFTFDPTTGGLPEYYSAVPYSNTVGTGSLTYLKQQYPDAISHVGILAGSLTGSVGAQIALQVSAMKSLGYTVVYQDGLSSVTPATVTPEIVRMQQAGVQFVAITSINDTGVSAFLNAAQQQGWNPAVVWNTGTVYDTAFQKSIAPNAANNLVVTTNLGPFREGSGSANLGVRLFRKWINVAKPGFVPDVWAAYSWSAAALFVQALQAAGPNFTQATLLTALSKIHKFNAGGLIATADVGRKTPSICYATMIYKNNAFVSVNKPKNGGTFLCQGKNLAPTG